MIVNAWVHVITNKSMGTCLCDLSIDDSMGTCYNVYINKTATEKAESTLNFKQYTCEGSESIPIVRKILKGLLNTKKIMEVSNMCKSMKELSENMAEKMAYRSTGYKNLAMKKDICMIKSWN